MPIKRRKKKGLTKHKSILLVCEGKETEVIYFERLKQLLNLPNVTIKVDGTGKSGISLLNTASGKVSNSKKNFDSVWIIFDKDNLPRDQLELTFKKAEERNIGVGFTNLCFETWLLLHFEFLNGEYDLTKTKLHKKMSDYLKVKYGESKSQIDIIGKIAERWETAKQHSEALMSNQNDRYVNPYSNIHIVLNDLIPNK
ncbi:RloB family protein [Virgibacillus sp. AGTR]|uniref:RloB family protein n=1 Tax=Virgibacillus TaxID=84406 RepID=UPI001D1618AD|nr:RloB family protein [Virgibacillus sp. AGTR]MCC2250483.1 RloB family protein [Virgibacillus sp. AGTR]